MGDRKALRMYWRPLVFFVLGMLSIAMLVVTYQISEGLRINFAVTDAIETTIIRVTTAHLLFEHSIAGDTTGDIRNVWADLDDAIRLVTVILNGGDAEHGMVLTPLKDAELRTRVEGVRSLLGNFKALAVQRYQEPMGSPGIPMLDRRIDAVFKEFRGKAISLETLFEQRQIHGQTRTRDLFSGMLLLWGAIVVVTTTVLWNREKRRRETEEEIKNVAKFPSENPSPLLRISQEGRILYANEASHALLENLGRNVGDEAPQFWRNLTSEVLLSRSRKIVDVTLDNRVFSFTVAPIPSGGYANMYGQDITQRKQAEERLKMHQDRLEDLVLERTTELLTANVSLQEEITERKRAEENMRIYKEIIENMPIGALVWHLESVGDASAFRLVSANPAITLISGLAREEIVGRALLENLPALEHTDIPKIAAEVVRSGNARDLGEVLYGDDRVSEGYFSVRIFPLPGNCAGVIVDNVTDRKRAEEALLDSENRYRAIVEAFDGFIYICSQDYHVEFMNERMKERAGGDATGKPCYEVLHGRDSICPWCVNEKVFSGETVRWEILSPKDNRWYYVVNTPIYRPDGSMSKQAMIQDITDRKQAEETLRENEKKFRKLSQEFYTLLEAITDPLTLLSPDLKILWGNKSALALAGHRVTDISGQSCHTLWHNRAIPCEGCPVIKSLQTGKEESTRLEDREARLWELRAFPVKDEEGKVGNVLTVASDVTEKSNLEAEARRMAHLASLGELAAGVAHEINNPVNGIINYAQMLVNKSTTGSRENEIATSIIKEGDRIASIVKSLLSFARATKTEKIPAKVHEILMDSLSLTVAQMRKDGVILQVDVPPDLPEIFAHSQQIQQVFLNIISNARYALNQKYPSVHKEKRLKIQGERVTIDNRSYVRITFYDQGVGIPGDVLDKVMNPFFSTKPRGKGTGLGLSISHGIITDHGGRLTVQSVEGNFTRVTVDLPIKEDA